VRVDGGQEQQDVRLNSPLGCSKIPRRERYHGSRSREILEEGGRERLGERRTENTLKEGSKAKSMKKKRHLPIVS